MIGKITVDYDQRHVYLFDHDALIIVLDPTDLPPRTWIPLDDIPRTDHLLNMIRTSLEVHVPGREVPAAAADQEWPLT